MIISGRAHADDLEEHLHLQGIFSLVWDFIPVLLFCLFICRCDCLVKGLALQIYGKQLSNAAEGTAALHILRCTPCSPNSTCSGLFVSHRDSMRTQQNEAVHCLNSLPTCRPVHGRDQFQVGRAPAQACKSVMDNSPLIHGDVHTAA